MRRSIALPCVLEAGDAKTMADTLLSRAWASRDRLTLRLGPSDLDLTPGDLVQPEDVAGNWIVESVEIERMVVTAALRPAWRSAGTRVADPGRPMAQADVVALPTRLALFDLTDVGMETSGAPSLQLAAASPSGTYRAMPIRIGVGASDSASLSAAVEAVLGKATTVLAPGPAEVIDAEASVEVLLTNADHWLQSCDDAALVAGANPAAVGDELVQFGRADAVGPGRFRLSRLLRGRRGSEWATTGHSANEPFVLIDARALKAIPAPVEAIGSAVTITAYGPGNDGQEPVETRIVRGEAAVPLSPAQLRATVRADGSIAIDWVRRSRRGFAWIDAVDVPEDADFAGYRVALSGVLSTAELSMPEPTLLVSAADLVALGAGPLSITVHQVGATGLSRPATLLLGI